MTTTNENPIHHSTQSLADAARAEGLGARSWSVSRADTMIAVYDDRGFVGTITGALATKGGCKADREILERIVARIQRAAVAA